MLPNLLFRNRTTRVCIRKLRRCQKRLAGFSDAYGDLICLAKAHPNAVVLDIGAFVGDTVERFRDECPNEIHAFEPTSASFAILKKRFSGDRQVTCWNLALGASVGKTSFHLNGVAQTNSLLAASEAGKKSFGQDIEEISKEEVSVETLDSWIAREIPGREIILKADVQGAERLLFEGGAESLERAIIAVYSEALLASHYEGQADLFEIDSILRGKHGYVLRDLYRCGRDADGNASWLDGLWLRGNLPAR